MRSHLKALFILILLTFPLAAWSTGAPTLLILGDSLSAGYGVPTGEGWVSLLDDRLQKRGMEFQVRNASISGETTDGGARRLPDLLDRYDPAIVVIELGGNDGLRGFPPQVTRDNLADMITRAQSRGAQVLLIGMRLPPNYGPQYTQAFARIFPALADEHDIALVPFLLKDVYNHDGMMQGDGIHPNASAQSRLLSNVWPYLEPLLSEAKKAQARASDQ
ncbi:arylesterase [Marinobacteraceae bacterium S3BR75-40.1]